MEKSIPVILDARLLLKAGIVALECLRMDAETHCQVLSFFLKTYGADDCIKEKMANKACLVKPLNMSLLAFAMSSRWKRSGVHNPTTNMFTRKSLLRDCVILFATV